MFSFFKNLYQAYKPIFRYNIFILQIIGWVVLLFLLTPILLSLFNGLFKSKVQISDFILFITAAFILAYTYETKKLKEETIFQRKMASASDTDFSLVRMYNADDHPNNLPFCRITAQKSINNVSDFVFLTGLISIPTGECGEFTSYEDGTLGANFFIKKESRKYFLKTLELRNGEITAEVSTTDGNKFIYTYRALTENWRDALDGKPKTRDSFVLVKKELR